MYVVRLFRRLSEPRNRFTEEQDDELLRISGERWRISKGRSYWEHSSKGLSGHSGRSCAERVGSLIKSVPPGRLVKKTKLGVDEAKALENRVKDLKSVKELQKDLKYLTQSDHESWVSV